MYSDKNQTIAQNHLHKTVLLYLYFLQQQQLQHHRINFVDDCCFTKKHSNAFLRIELSLLILNLFKTFG